MIEILQNEMDKLRYEMQLLIKVMWGLLECIWEGMEWFEVYILSFFIFYFANQSWNEHY